MYLEHGRGTLLQPSGTTDKPGHSKPLLGRLQGPKQTDPEICSSTGLQPHHATWLSLYDLGFLLQTQEV